MLLSRMVTMRDIAAEAGVSIKTVSRALNGTGYVEQTRKEVILKIAGELRYTPNLFARTLKTRRTQEIMVPFSSLDELHMSKLAGLADYLRQHGFSLSLSYCHKNTPEADLPDFTRHVFSRNPAGIILMAPEPFFQAYWIRQAEEAQTPLVIVDPHACGSDVPAETEAGEGLYQVKLDRGKGVEESVEYLIRQGYRRIAYIGPPGDSTRLPAYRRAVKAAGREEYTFFVTEKDLREGYRQAADRILDSGHPPDAVQLYSDETAMYFLSRLHERHAAVPSDLAVVGFDDRWAAGKASPALTTVAQPSLELGRLAGSMILKAMSNELDPLGETWETATHLVIRESA